MSYLGSGLPVPRAETDGLSAPFWDAANNGILKIQRCSACANWQWGPEWICHNCHSFDLDWAEVAGEGRIYSWERSHHPVHPTLKDQVPYVAVLVELPGAGSIRMLGNLLGDPLDDVVVGAPVEAVFEHHTDVEPPYTLVQWQRKTA